VGGRAFNTWEQIPEGFLEFCRNQIPKHRRPGAKNQEMIGRIIAQNIPELSNGKVFGDCDETHAQIAARAHGRVSVGEVASALKSLDGNVFLITRKPAKGRSGTHRVIHPELASHQLRKRLGTKFTVATTASSSSLTDLLILSTCSAIVTSNSSLSWWSAFIGWRMRNSKIYVPTPWLAQQHINDDQRLHESWIRIRRSQGFPSEWLTT